MATDSIATSGGENPATLNPGTSNPATSNPTTPNPAAVPALPEAEILRAEALYHVYESQAEEGNVVALRGLTLSVRAGEAVAVVGPSGSGKSTLLKALGGLMKPSAGRVFLSDRDITRLSGPELVEARRSTVSFIFQEGNLLPHLSALDNVMHPLRHRGVPAREARRRAVAVLRALGMEPRMRALPAKLSGGEQQRVAIARALITRPRLILADEPTGAVDPVTSQTVMELFERLHEQEQTAFLVVTHNEEVAAFADRSLELLDGRFVGQHGVGVDLEDLSQTREIIIDELGTLVLPPDILMEMGGAGRVRLIEHKRGRLVLEREELLNERRKGGRKYRDDCGSCGHHYEEPRQRACPSCGAKRRLARE